MHIVCASMRSDPDKYRDHLFLRKNIEIIDDARTHELVARIFIAFGVCSQDKPFCTWLQQADVSFARPLLRAVCLYYFR